MNKWSRRRKRIIVSLIFIAFIILVAVPAYLLFYKPPSCFDNKQNGDETGIDCGGSCQLLCTAESLPLIIKGDPQIIQVTNNAFEVVTLIENPNIDAEIYRARYFIRLYGVQSISPIRVIEGETFVPKGTTFAIFEGPFNVTTDGMPLRATIEWRTSTLVWKKNNATVPKIRIVSKVLSRVESSPRIDAVISNTSLSKVSNIDLVALVYDENGSIFAASKTFIDSLPAGANVSTVFSWPMRFEKEAVSIEIIPRILPDKSFLR